MMLSPVRYHYAKVLGQEVTYMTESLAARAQPQQQRLPEV